MKQYASKLTNLHIFKISFLQLIKSATIWVILTIAFILAISGFIYLVTSFRSLTLDQFFRHGELSLISIYLGGAITFVFSSLLLIMSFIIIYSYEEKQNILLMIVSRPISRWSIYWQKILAVFSLYFIYMIINSILFIPMSFIISSEHSGYFIRMYGYLAVALLLAFILLSSLYLFFVMFLRDLLSIILATFIGIFGLGQVAISLVLYNKAVKTEDRSVAPSILNSLPSYSKWYKNKLKDNNYNNLNIALQKNDYIMLIEALNNYGFDINNQSRNKIFDGDLFIDKDDILWAEFYENMENIIKNDDIASNNSEDRSKWTVNDLDELNPLYSSIYLNQDFKQQIIYEIKSKSTLNISQIKRTLSDIRGNYNVRILNFGFYQFEKYYDIDNVLSYFNVFKPYYVIQSNIIGINNPRIIDSDYNNFLFSSLFRIGLYKDSAEHVLIDWNKTGYKNSWAHVIVQTIIFSSFLFLNFIWFKRREID